MEFWAARPQDASRRLPIEDEGRAFQYRNAFQRDRDRIVYSRAFRRLRQKGQAGLLPEYEDHRRNRLTHTLEVVQLARTTARALGLNEDLAEAVALGHDLGQPPFGPTGAEALDDWLSGRLDGHGGSGLGDLGGFSCSEQALTTIDRIEKRYNHEGLNLTDPVREGILKCHPYRDERIKDDSLRPGLPPLLEVQLVRLCDRITTAVHDLDDALQAGVLDPGRVERLALVQALKKKLGASWPTRKSPFLRANAIHRGLLHLLATSLVTYGRRRVSDRMKRAGVKDAKSFQSLCDEILQGDELTLAPKVQGGLEDLEGFLKANVGRRFEQAQTEALSRRVLLGLLAAYLADPVLLPDHVLIRYRIERRRPFLRDLDRPTMEAEASRMRDDPQFARALTDFLAATTDPYARREHRRLIEMGAVPIPGAEQLRRERGHGSLD